MYQISNRQYDEVIQFLSAYVATERRGISLPEQNRFRRARLLIRDLKKRNPITNNQNK